MDKDKLAQKRAAQHDQLRKWDVYFHKNPPKPNSPLFWKEFKEVVDYTMYIEQQLIIREANRAKEEKSPCHKITQICRKFSRAWLK